jgi:hypothetical protein
MTPLGKLWHVPTSLPRRYEKQSHCCQRNGCTCKNTCHPKLGSKYTGVFSPQIRVMELHFHLITRIFTGRNSAIGFGLMLIRWKEYR